MQNYNLFSSNIPFPSLAWKIKAFRRWKKATCTYPYECVFCGHQFKTTRERLICSINCRERHYKLKHIDEDRKGYFECQKCEYGFFKLKLFILHKTWCSSKKLFQDFVPRGGGLFDSESESLSDSDFEFKSKIELVKKQVGDVETSSNTSDSR